MFARKLDVITMVLLIIGGLNWGLVGLFGFNLVASLFGTMSLLSRIIYVLVGISALYQIVQWGAMQRRACMPTRVYRDREVTV